VTVCVFYLLLSVKQYSLSIELTRNSEKIKNRKKETLNYPNLYHITHSTHNTQLKLTVTYEYML